MYPRRFEYLVPRTLKEALAALKEHGAEAKLLGGGQSLIPLLKLRLVSPEYIVDLGRIPGLAYLRPNDGQILIGALTRHAQIEHSALVRARLPLMHDAAQVIGDVQVRNLGTFGGALAHGEPAGDWGPVALALGAQIRAQGPDGERLIPASAFFTDAYTTALAPDEILTEVVIPAPPSRSSGAYLKLERRAGDFPVVSVAVQVTLDEKGSCQEVGIGLGAAALTPLKARAAEALLKGEALSPSSIAAAAARAAQESDPLPDIRGSAEYKRELVRVLCHRALHLTERRLRGEEASAGHV